MQGIKNIIFDLGGVIIDLSQETTIYELNRLSEVPFETLYSQGLHEPLFNDFDRGLISEENFFAELKGRMRYKGPNEDLLDAWNAMLLDIPEHRLELLFEAKQHYNTFLLSNTCEPHITAFEHDLYIQHGVRNFNDYFDGVYYSCRLGMRKPDREIFEHVLSLNQLLPAETVFIDDSEQRVKGAGACGIKSYLLPKGMDIGDFIKELNLLT
jgi:glucose-1-phosphatase